MRPNATNVPDLAGAVPAVAVHVAAAADHGGRPTVVRVPSAAVTANAATGVEIIVERRVRLRPAKAAPSAAAGIARNCPQSVQNSRAVAARPGVQIAGTRIAPIEIARNTPAPTSGAVTEVAKAGLRCSATEIRRRKPARAQTGPTAIAFAVIAPRVPALMLTVARVTAVKATGRTAIAAVKAVLPAPMMSAARVATARIATTAPVTVTGAHMVRTSVRANREPTATARTVQRHGRASIARATGQQSHMQRAVRLSAVPVPTQAARAWKA